jgi:beta-fructofuranosidase
MKEVGHFGFSFLLVAFMFAAATPAHAVAPTDKTLVVWVCPATIHQMGGSALTVQSGEQFDGIVFAELRRFTWMAGSDRLKRTNRSQDYPAEKAPEGKGSDGRFSQIAIVYGGGKVTLSKNGEVLDSYSASSVDLLSRDDLLLVFGIRHVGLAGLGRFHGKIDDARVYRQALTAEQIKSLRPNQRTADSPEPVAWFDFNGEEAVDRAGNFGAAKLMRTARLEGGNLVLDDGDVLVAAANQDVLEKNFRLPGQSFDIANIDQYDWPTMPDSPPATWTTYHLAHPGPGDANPGDPNCAFYWKGLYHLFYIYRRPEGFSFAHVASRDMVHWQWYPTTLTPKFTGHGMFSGTALFTKEGEPFIVYNGQGSGRNQISFPADDLAVTWEEPLPINVVDPKTGDRANIVFADPDCWLVDDTYYAMNGGIDPVVYKSKDLKKWELIGPLLKFKNDPNRKEPLDVSCANLFPIGDHGKWMLHFISHDTGCRYYLGEWKDEQFVVEEEHYMSWRRRSLFAQESLLTPDGRRVMWAWCFAARRGFGSCTGVQCLPRELHLPKDGILRIKPLRELESLRYDEKTLTNLQVKAGRPLILKGIRGDVLELEITIAASKAAKFGVNVFCDQKGTSGAALVVNRKDNKLETTYEKAPFKLEADEETTLRVFLDKAMIELFANERQAMVDAAKHSPENVGVSLFAEGGDLKVTSVKAWKMSPPMTAENARAQLPSSIVASASAAGEQPGPAKQPSTTIPRFGKAKHPFVKPHG